MKLKNIHGDELHELYISPDNTEMVHSFGSVVCSEIPERMSDW
jgi:hypothetical protein